MDLESTQESSNGANVFHLHLDGYDVTLFAQTGDLRLYSSLAGQLDMARVNAWNQKHRFSRAYVNESGNPVVEADLDLGGGVTRESVETFIKQFRTTLREYGKLVGPQVQARTAAPMSIHKKSISATKNVKTPFGDFALWIDPAKWKQTTADGPNMLKFANVNGEAFAMIISERLTIPTDSLPDVALLIAQKAAPDTRITFQEKRIVNGRQILAMQLDGTLKNLPFKYYGYYYGGTSGTIQVVTFTLASAFERNVGEFTTLLDGLEISDQDLPSPPKTASDAGLLIVNSGTMEIKYDPKKWKRTESKDAGRFSFKHAAGDGYALVIAERVAIPTDAFPGIALTNAQKVDPNARITLREKRKVNGVDVWFLKMDADSSGVPLTYYGYYYGGDSAAIQILTYTGRNLAEEYEKDFMDFLNGFRLTEQP